MPQKLEKAVAVVVVVVVVVVAVAVAVAGAGAGVGVVVVVVVAVVVVVVAAAGVVVVVVVVVSSSTARFHIVFASSRSCSGRWVRPMASFWSMACYGISLTEAILTTAWLEKPCHRPSAVPACAPPRRVLPKHMLSGTKHAPHT